MRLQVFTTSADHKVRLDTELCNKGAITILPYSMQLQRLFKTGNLFITGAVWGLARKMLLVFECCLLSGRATRTSTTLVS